MKRPRGVWTSLQKLVHRRERRRQVDNRVVCVLCDQQFADMVRALEHVAQRHPDMWQDARDQAEADGYSL